MQSLVLPPSSFTTTQFGHPRLNPVSERFFLNQNRSSNARQRSSRDLPPLHSMSGPVPTEESLETLGNVRRSGHSEVTAGPTTPVTAPTATSSGASGTVLAPGSPAQDLAFQHASSTSGDETRQPFAFGDSLPPSRLPLAFTGSSQSAPQHPASTFPPSTFGTSPPGTTPRALPPKPTRRTKAHVASACVNCKKKHLGCDSARPCRRCVLSGKEATCVDVTHKKRGRPPLKTEDASLRSFASQMDNAATSGQQTSQPRRTYMHRVTGSREIRPMTDLQIPGTQSGAVGLRGSTGHPHRWTTSVFPQVPDPSLSMRGNLGHRRFSSSGSIQHMAVASPPGFIPIAGGYNPALGAGHMPMGAGRAISSYTHQPLPPATTPPQYQQPFGMSISPYTENSRVGNREPPMSRDSRENYPESPVRLPPIFPPTLPLGGPAPQGHRFSDPYPAVSAAWSPRTREEILQHQQIPQGMIEPISPNSPMRRPASDSLHGEPAPHPAAQRHSVQLSSIRTREQPTAEPETGESRPTKRRKMALDDMVND